MVRRALALVSVSLASAVAACAPSWPAGRAAPTAAVTPSSSVAREPASSPATRVGVAVRVRGPLHVRYDQTIGGPEKPGLAVVVTNGSAQPLDVSDLHVHLTATRERVSFHCANEVGAGPGVREPSTLAPGESYTFDRELDCALPLVGAYAVRVAVSFGSGAFKTPRDVQALTLTVTALPNVEPREVEGVPGLWASMSANNKLPGGVGRGVGRSILAIVNGTRRPIELPRMLLALRVYRVGNPIPCVDQPRELPLPPVLAPGETHYESVEISCLGLSDPGTYDVAPWLIVPQGSEGDRQIALGRLRVDVITDPTVFIPPTW